MPSRGPPEGGTVFVLIGGGFLSMPGAFCRFLCGGNRLRQSSARHLSSSRLKCETPPSFGSSFLTVLVSNNGVDFTSGGPQFLFEPAPTVIQLLPSRLPPGSVSTLIT
eukprot:223359-Rhodomonas_salina.1